MVFPPLVDCLFLIFFVVVECKPRTSFMLAKCSTTSYNLQLDHNYFYHVCWISRRIGKNIDLFPALLT
jgi:hypothetical protein